MQIHLVLIKIVEESGKNTVFHIDDMSDKIVYRAENGQWFEDEAWYISDFCKKNKIRLFYSEKTVDISDTKWFNNSTCAGVNNE